MPVSYTHLDVYKRQEFVREWLMENGFQGKEGQQVPEMTPEIVNSISERYMEPVSYTHLCGISRWQGPHQVAQISIYTYFPLTSERETFLPDKSVQLKFGERAPTDNLRQRLHNVSKVFTNSGDFTYRSNTAQ